MENLVFKKTDILKRTMQEMPRTFTSNEFNKKAVKNGYPKRIIKSTGTSNFVRKYAKNEYRGSKTWHKIKQNNHSFNGFDYEAKDIEFEIDLAIKLLKKNGYKIYKPINKWEEI